jgi:hypothetical protein
MWGVDVPAGFVHVFRFSTARLPFASRQKGDLSLVTKHGTGVRAPCYIKVTRRRRRWRYRTRDVALTRCRPSRWPSRRQIGWCTRGTSDHLTRLAGAFPERRAQNQETWTYGPVMLQTCTNRSTHPVSCWFLPNITIINHLISLHYVVVWRTNRRGGVGAQYAHILQFQINTARRWGKTGSHYIRTSRQHTGDHFVTAVMLSCFLLHTTKWDFSNIFRNIWEKSQDYHLV